MPIDPNLIAQLVILVIEILLKVFGGNAQKVSAYLRGDDLPWWNLAAKMRRAGEIRGLVMHVWHGKPTDLDAADDEARMVFAKITTSAVVNPRWFVPQMLGVNPKDIP